MLDSNFHDVKDWKFPNEHEQKLSHTKIKSLSAAKCQISWILFQLLFSNCLSNFSQCTSHKIYVLLSAKSFASLLLLLSFPQQRVYDVIRDRRYKEFVVDDEKKSKEWKENFSPSKKVKKKYTRQSSGSGRGNNLMRKTLRCVDGKTTKICKENSQETIYVIMMRT